MSGTAHHGNTPFDVPFISQIDETGARLLT